MKQIENVGDAQAKSLSRNGVTTLAKVMEMDPRDLERILGRNPPYGNKLQDAVSRLPQLKIDISQQKNLSKPKTIDLYFNLGLLNSDLVKIGFKSNLDYIFYAFSNEELLDVRQFS